MTVDQAWAQMWALDEITIRAARTRDRAKLRFATGTITLPCPTRD